MNPERRLAAIATALRSAGLACLVMGGHAARFYGVQRTTIDFDLHLTPDGWEDLAGRLAALPLFALGLLVEGPSWRPHAFRRFQIGQLPDGREEWLEFWRENHLLPPFECLFARREEGEYGGAVLPFLALPDLIRSKETERVSDWQDVDLLEEILDARHRGRLAAGHLPVRAALEAVRTRVGVEALHQGGWLGDPAVVAAALSGAAQPVTQALLLPFAPAAVLPDASPIEPVVVSRLRTVAALSPLHRALVEVVRRQYRVRRQEEDRLDKQAVRSAPPRADG